MSEKVVLITGASKGIGKAIAEVAGKKNIVSLFSRSETELKSISETLNKQGSKSIFFAGDIKNELDIKNAVQKTIDTYGRIDILVNNAGIGYFKEISEFTYQEFDEIQKVNLYGTFLFCKYVSAFMIKAKSGYIINISSVAGLNGFKTGTAYSASKFALEGWLESLRIENLKSGVHVLIARPGFTATNIRNTAMNAKGTAQGESHKDEAQSMSADEVAKHVIQAIEKRSNYLLLTSNAHLTFWLNKFIPKWVDRQVFKFVAKEKDSPLK